MTKQINSVKDELKGDIKGIELSIAELPKKIKNEFKGEFADQWVEDVIIWAARIIGMAIIIVVIGVIATAFIKFNS